MSRSAWRLVCAAAVMVGLAACHQASGSPVPAAADSGLAGPSSTTPSANASEPTAASSPAADSQTDTPWGRIWDSLPAGFPAYAGSTPAAEAATGAASAVLAIHDADAKTIADFMRSKLELASYSTEALNGPLEDGSYVLDSTGPAPGCRVQVSIAPLGGVTTLTVLYGASCPKP